MKKSGHLTIKTLVIFLFFFFLGRPKIVRVKCLSSDKTVKSFKIDFTQSIFRAISKMMIHIFR